MPLISLVSCSFLSLSVGGGGGGGGGGGSGSSGLVRGLSLLLAARLDAKANLSMAWPLDRE